MTKEEVMKVPTTVYLLEMMDEKWFGYSLRWEVSSWTNKAKDIHR